MKEKVKRHVEEPGMMAPSTAAAPAPMAVAAAASGGGVKQGTASPSKRKDAGPAAVKSKGGISTSQKSGEPGRRVV